MPRHTKPPRVEVEYDTSPEGEAGYVSAVRLVLEMTIERRERGSVPPCLADAPPPAAGPGDVAAG